MTSARRTGHSAGGNPPHRQSTLGGLGVTNTRQANVLGVGVSACSMEEVLTIVISAIENGVKGYICATGVHGVMEAQKDANLRAVLNGCLINVADGMPTVWVGRLQGLRGMSLVGGPDLMLRVCALSMKKGYSHFLYGGNEGVAERLRDRLVDQFPSLKVVGTYTPPFRRLSADEESKLSQLVSRLKPDIFWVGLSTPKQERFVAEYLHKLDTTLMFAVGAAFDFHTGKFQESPEWVKVIGMRWFHRLCKEPRRLWKRYLLNNPRFMASIFLQLAGLKTYDLIP